MIAIENNVVMVYLIVGYKAFQLMCVWNIAQALSVRLRHLP